MGWFNKLFTKENEPGQTELCEFARAHGVDPHDVPVGGITLNDDRTVTFDVFERDTNGRVAHMGDHALTRPVTVQQAVPWPFPGQEAS